MIGGGRAGSAHFALRVQAAIHKIAKQWNLPIPNRPRDGWSKPFSTTRRARIGPFVVWITLVSPRDIP